MEEECDEIDIDDSSSGVPEEFLDAIAGDDCDECSDEQEEEAPRQRKGQGKQGTKFCITWQLGGRQTQPDEDWDILEGHIKALVEDKQLAYAVFGFERAPTTGKAHAQGYIEVGRHVRQTRWAQVMEVLKHEELRHPHVIPARGTAEQNRAYCTGNVDGKSPNEKVFELGEPRKKGPKPGLDYAAQLELIRAGKMHETDPRLQIMHFGNMQKINFSYPRNYTELAELRNEWVWGAPGVGKSKYARERARQLGLAYYVKDAQTKWFDQYQHEPCVIIDDLELDAKYQIHLLKMIGDHYPTRVEIKGAYTEIRPQVIIVTSNYSPDTIWEEKNQRDAIRRRYKVTHMMGTQPALGSPQRASTGGIAHSYDCNCGSCLRAFNGN